MTSPPTVEPTVEPIDELPAVTLVATPPRSPRFSVIGVVLCLLALGGGGWLLWRLFAPATTPGPAIAQAAALPVQTIVLQSQPIVDRADYVAQLKSRRSVSLRPQIQGQVTQIWVQPGQTVRKGTRLIQINPNEQLAVLQSGYAAIAAAEANVENARAMLRSLQASRLSKQADVKFAEQDYQRFAFLAEQGAGSLQLRDQYANKLAVAKAAVQAVEAEIRAQQAAIVRAEQNRSQTQALTQQQQVQLQYFQISAPFSGVVGDIPVKVGDLVNVSTPLITVAENDQLEINFSVPVEQVSQLRVGDAIDLLNQRGDRIGNSQIFFIAPNTDHSNQSVLVKARLHNRNGQQRTDQFVRVRVRWNQRTGVLVPTPAITRLGGEAFVFVAKPTQSGFVAHQQLVKLGRVDGNRYQVVEGLKPGDRVVVSGLVMLRDGSPIQPTEPSPR